MNFDPEADKNGGCRYTKVIFYAPSDRVGGSADKVTKIEIFRGPTPDQLFIGTIATFNQSRPSGCTAPEGAFEYELTDGSNPVLFLFRYYYDNGADEAGGSLSFSASNTVECLVESLTL